LNSYQVEWFCSVKNGWTVQRLLVRRFLVELSSCPAVGNGAGVILVGPEHQNIILITKKGVQVQASLCGVA
jgi:hypothetical protein